MDLPGTRNTPMDERRLPFLSCLCATKNRKRFLEQSIRQFLAQDYRGGAELLIVEDGEEDSSDLVFESRFWPCRPEREGSDVRYFRFEASLGMKLNFAAEHAFGEICCHWDDDDWYGPMRLTRQMEHMRLTGKAFVACSSALYYEEGDQVAYEYTGSASYASGFSQCYRRDWILENPHPDVSLGEDAIVIQKAHEQGVLSTISGMDFLVARNHSANTSVRNMRNPEMRELLLASDQWREVPLARIAGIVPRSSLPATLVA